MEALIDLASRAEAQSIKEWFAFREWTPPDDTDWDNFMSLPNELSAFVDQLSEFDQSLIHEDIRRINRLANANGLHALYQVYSDVSELASLTDDFDRCLWVFRQSQNAFTSAETLLDFQNVQGKSRGWSLFETDPGIAHSAIEARRSTFEDAIIRTTEGGQYCKVSSYSHPNSDIIQLNVFHQKDPQTAMTFDKKGRLIRTLWQPTGQFVILYDWGVGEIEIAGGNKKERTQIAKLVGLILLDNAPVKDISRRLNNLSCFSMELALPKINGVETVDIIGTCIAISEKGLMEDRKFSGVGRTFHQMMDDKYEDKNPFLSPHVIRSGTLRCICRAPGNSSHFNEVIIHLTRTSCTFRKYPDNATKERFETIYLPHWGISQAKETQ
ncbi:hypothetical protein [Sansalvadorimonas verongulae]|uniref:hypothetical protein n=1 Tax=Sansalvadorimonas verongulae TaxID=2172824 RepID=UPI0012BC25A5|nr:hypothetical protein [Sansalvadorimonas verongulae]MTI12326.1 hypothetical protein [Sansalvadorimonas verongulae]